LRRAGSSVARPVRHRLSAVARPLRRTRLPCDGRDRQRGHDRPQLDRLVGIAKAAAERPRDRSRRCQRLLRTIDHVACQAWMRMRMTHLVEQLRDETARNIATMREAALRARETHARAELMRHMLMTASKVKEQPAERAVRFILQPSLRTWRLALGLR